MRTRRGIVPIALGVVLIVAALGLSAYNLYDDFRAGSESQEVAVQLQEQMTAKAQGGSGVAGVPGGVEGPASDALENPAAMPVSEVGGLSCVALLTVPSVNLMLPIQDTWSYEALRAAPCRFTGSVYSGDMVIAGHAYNSHFGKLRQLKPGDELLLQDMLGNAFTYYVVETEVLEPSEVEAMVASGYELTLFTCTFDGSSRFTVRCAAGRIGSL